MFDISWTEFLLIGIVALIVIGPKELPGVMRTLGQYTRKIRSMASDFQNQFQEAMREAEMADLKKEVDDVASGIKNFDPLKAVREDVESIGAIGKDFEKSLDKPAETKPVELTPDAGGDVLPAVSPAAPEPVAFTAEPRSTERTG
jgi:sec-independent protein translocase protein TatB